MKSSPLLGGHVPLTYDQKHKFQRSGIMPLNRFSYSLRCMLLSGCINLVLQIFATIRGMLRQSLACEKFNTQVSGALLSLVRRMLGGALGGYGMPPFHRDEDPICGNLWGKYCLGYRSIILLGDFRNI